MRLLLQLVAGAAALALALGALVTLADGLGLVRAFVEAFLSDGMMPHPDEVDGGTWGWARLALRALEAGGVAVLAVGIVLGAAGARARGVVGIVAAAAGAALGLAVLVALVVGAGALGDRVLAPFIRADFDYTLAVGAHLRTGLVVHAVPALAVLAGGLALAANAWASRGLGVGAPLAAAAVWLALPLRGLTTVLVFRTVQERAWGETPWGALEGLLDLAQLAGDGLLALAGLAGLVAVALLTPRPAPADG